MSKTVQTLGHLHSFHTTKVKCKILQASLQQYLNHNFLVFKLGLEKSAEPETIANIHQIIEKQENSRKIYIYISALLTVSKHLTTWITTNCGKFFKRWEYLTTLLLPGKSVCRPRSNSWNQTGNSFLVPNCKMSTSRFIVTLLI